MIFNKKIEGYDNIVEFLKLPVIGLKVIINYSLGSKSIQGIILKNNGDWITLQTANDTFTIVISTIDSLKLKQSDYNCIYNLKKIKEESKMSKKEQLLNQLEQIKKR